jgi:hypothetical protein
MATVTMKKGDRFADIFDSPETIAQAQRDGFHICSETESKLREEQTKKASKQGPEKLDNGLAAGPELALPFDAEKRKQIEAQVIEAGKITADKATTLSDEDLLALFNTIKKGGSKRDNNKNQ